MILSTQAHQDLNDRSPLGHSHNQENKLPPGFVLHGDSTQNSQNHSLPQGFTSEFTQAGHMPPGFEQGIAKMPDSHIPAGFESEMHGDHTLHRSYNHHDFSDTTQDNDNITLPVFTHQNRIVNMNIPASNLASYNQLGCKWLNLKRNLYGYNPGRHQ